MGGNTGEIQLGSERELYKYINQGGTTKASTRIILVQMYAYNRFRLLIGVPDYSMHSESYREKQKLIGQGSLLFKEKSDHCFTERGVCKS